MSTVKSQKKPDSPARILLVDDHTDGLSARTALLQELGYRVTSFSNSREALDHLAEEPFDLVITDFRMPQLTGVELIAKLREKYPQVPMILISGFAETLGLNPQSTGADLVVQKDNYEVTNLVAAVQRLLKAKAGKRPPGRHSGARARRAAG